MPLSSADAFIEQYLTRYAPSQSSRIHLPAWLTWPLALFAAAASLLCLRFGLETIALLIGGIVIALAAVGALKQQIGATYALASLIGYLSWHLIAPESVNITTNQAVVGILGILVGYLLDKIGRLKIALDREATKAQKLRQLSEILVNSDGACLKEIDLSGKLVGMSLKGQTLMEVCNFEQINEADWISFWPEELKHTVRHTLAQASKGQAGRFTGFCPTLSGTGKWWDVLVIPVLDQHGQAESVLSLSWDITAVYQSTAALKTAHEEMNALLEDANDGFFSIDRQWQFTQVNSKAEELLRRKRDSLLGANFCDLFPEASNGEFGAAYKDAMDSGIPRHFEAYFAPFDVWFRVDAYPRPQGIAVFFRNITSQVEALQQSQATATRLRLTQEMARSADWQFTLASSELTLSEQALQLLGLPQQDYSHHQDALVRMLHPDDRLTFVSALLDVSEGRTSLNVLARIRDVNRPGFWRDLQFTGALMTSQAHPQGLLVGFMQDISKQQRRERQLIEAESYASSIINALPQLVCVLDECGHLMTANQAWNRFVEDEQGVIFKATEGKDYLEIYRDLALAGDPCAQALVDQLETSLNGTGDPFSVIYEFKLGEISRFFHITAALMPTEQKQLLVVHEDITDTIHMQQMLATQAQRLELINEGSNDGLWEWRPEEHSLYVSERFIELTGIALDSHVDFISWLSTHTHADDREILSVALNAPLSDAAPLDVELRLDTPHGWRWFRLRGKAQWEADILVCFAGSLMDVSLQRNLLVQLQASETRFREMVEYLPHVFWIYDIAQAGLSYVSPAFEKIWAKSPQSLYDDINVWLDLIHPEDRDAALHFHDEVVTQHTQTEVEYRSWDANGHIHWLRNRAYPLHDATGAVVRIIGIAEDITEARTYQSRLVTVSHFDALSGLPNRVLFNQRLDAQCAHGHTMQQEFVLLLISLDRIKWVRQCLGQNAMNDLITSVATRLKTILHERGYLARLASDEFALLISREDELSQCHATLQLLLEAFDQPFLLGSDSIKLTTYLGAARFPNDADTAEALIKNASTAVYAAQQSGQAGCQFFNQALLQNGFETLKLETELNRALAQQEFILHYQPKVSLHDQRLCGAEALIRWVHPLHGLISPLRFVPLLEDTGLIIPVGHWCLDQALAQLAKWQAQGLDDFTMAINLSLRQLQPELIEQVRNALKRHNIAPACLELELTESMMNEAGKFTAIIEELKALGVRIAVDDFGTGYATLGSLKSFVPDTLKIDKSFLRDMISDGADQAIVKSVIDMAHALGMNVVAEGVEYSEQKDMLKQLNCDQIQGYLISPPVAASAFEEKYRLLSV